MNGPLCKLRDNARSIVYGDFLLTWTDTDGEPRKKYLTQTYQTTATMVAHGIGRRYGKSDE